MLSVDVAADMLVINGTGTAIQAAITITVTKSQWDYISPVVDTLEDFRVSHVPRTVMVRCPACKLLC